MPVPVPTIGEVSTHSRAKAADAIKAVNSGQASVSTHSRAKAAEYGLSNLKMALQSFQHTAARRRLTPILVYLIDSVNVSTHSRAKAADL